MFSAAYFRQKAEQFRKIANAMAPGSNDAKASLQVLAAEFDSHAATIDVERATNALIGLRQGLQQTSPSVIPE